MTVAIKEINHVDDYDSCRFQRNNSMMTSSNGNIFRVTGPLCGEFTGPGEFPTQRPVTRSFDVFFDLRLNKRLSKQPWGWWFETQSWSLWRHGNVIKPCQGIVTSAKMLYKISWRLCCALFCCLTHWDRDTVIFQTTFSNAFSWTKMSEFRLKFQWSSFLRVQLTISQHWFWKWLVA